MVPPFVSPWQPRVGWREGFVMRGDNTNPATLWYRFDLEGLIGPDHPPRAETVNLIETLESSALR